MIQITPQMRVLVAIEPVDGRKGIDSLLHRIRDGYLTMVDLFRTVISAGKLEEILNEIGSLFSTTNYIGIGKDAYREYEGLLSPLGFEWNKDTDLYLIVWTEALENLLTQETSATFDILPAGLIDPSSETASTASSIGTGNTAFLSQSPDPLHFCPSGREKSASLTVKCCQHLEAYEPHPLHFLPQEASIDCPSRNPECPARRLYFEECASQTNRPNHASPRRQSWRSGTTGFY